MNAVSICTHCTEAWVIPKSRTDYNLQSLHYNVPYLLNKHLPNNINIHTISKKYIRLSYGWTSGIRYFYFIVCMFSLSFTIYIFLVSFCFWNLYILPPSCCLCNGIAGSQAVSNSLLSGISSSCCEKIEIWLLTDILQRLTPLCS